MTPGGDQNYEAMAKDRRYTHYLGRPLNRFEPEEDKKGEKSKLADKSVDQGSLQSASGTNGYGAERVRKDKHEANQNLKQRRAELVFDKNMPSLTELHSIVDDFY